LKEKELSTFIKVSSFRKQVIFGGIWVGHFSSSGERFSTLLSQERVRRFTTPHWTSTF